MKTRTGLALSQVKGPLATLNNNLSGENGEYWLTALNKMLLKEEIPTPTPAVFKELEKLNPHREKMREKVNELAIYIKKIPVVSEVYVIDEDDDENDLINISVYASVATFIHNMQKVDTAGFYLRTDGTIHMSGIDPAAIREVDIDSVFKKWFHDLKKDGIDLKALCEALVELGNIYEKSILDIRI